MCWGDNTNNRATPPTNFVTPPCPLCGDGMYGVTCTSKCTTCEVHGSVTGDGCASRNATCTCDAGWYGPGCSITSSHGGSCKKVAAGSAQSCGVRGGDGHAVCWGYNGNNGATPPTPGVAIVIIAAGAYFGMAVRSSDGKPLCVVVDGRAMRMRRVAAVECIVAVLLLVCILRRSST